MTSVSGWPGKAAGWLRAGRGGLFLLALLIGAASGLGAMAFRYLIYFFTWLATGQDEFGQQGRVASGHLPWLGPAFFVLIPAVAENGGRIRPQVSVIKAVASGYCAPSPARSPAPGTRPPSSTTTRRPRSPDTGS